MPLLNDASAVYVGDTPATKVYLGNTLVWEPPSLGYAGRIKSLHPLCYWRLGEPAASPYAMDTRGVLNATYTGSPTLGVPSLLYDTDTSMTVAGINRQGVDMGNPTILQISTMTVEAWIKTSGAGSSYRAIIVKQDAFGLFSVDNVLSVYEWGGAGAISTGKNIADGKRHHVVCVFQPTGSQIYLDGVAVGPTFNHLAANQYNAMSIGYAGFAGQEFTGTIDEVAFYGYALTAAEIAGNYVAAPSWRPDVIPDLVTWLDASEYAAGAWPNKGSGPAVTVVGTPVMTAGAVVNGNPTVRFKVNEARVRSTWPYPVNDWTLLYVVRWIGPNPGRAFSVQYPPSNLLVGMHTSQPDTMYDNGTWQTPGTGWNVWSQAPHPPGPWRMYGADAANGVPSRFFIGGTIIGQTPSPNLGGFTNGWGLSGYDATGASETLDIEVAELVLYNRKLSDEDRQQVETYLGKKYGMTGYWTPNDIRGLGLWLEADKITGVTNGGGVTTWPDSSGQGRHATPVAAVPQWMQAGMNGKPTVKFTNSRMTISGWGSALSWKTEYTLFQVISQQAFGAYPVIACAPSYTTWGWINEFSPAPFGGIYWGHTNGNFHLYDAQVPPSTPTLLSYSYTNGAPRLFKNGTQITSYSVAGYGLGTIAVPDVGADVVFGAYYDGSYPLDDHVAAVIWYDHFLIDSERVQVENYLKTKYGIA